MGPIQFGWPRNIVKTGLLNHGFLRHVWFCHSKKRQNTEFTKFSGVQTPKLTAFNLLVSAPSQQVLIFPRLRCIQLGVRIS